MDLMCTPQELAELIKALKDGSKKINFDRILLNDATQTELKQGDGLTCDCCREGIVGKDIDHPNLAVDVSIAGETYTLCKDCARVVRWIRNQTESRYAG